MATPDSRPPTDVTNSIPLPRAVPYAKPFKFVVLPEAVCTTIGCVPYTEFEGIRQVICDELDRLTFVAGFPPIQTAIGAAKLAPSTVKGVPPVNDPKLGCTAVIRGCPTDGV